MNYHLTMVGESVCPCDPRGLLLLVESPKANCSWMTGQTKSDLQNLNEEMTSSPCLGQGLPEPRPGAKPGKGSALVLWVPIDIAQRGNLGPPFSGFTTCRRHHCG